MTDTSWLPSICSTEQSRPQISQPWTVRRADGPWTVATNGLMLAAIRGEYGFPAANDTTPNVEPVLAVNAPPRRLPLAELRALATPWAEPDLADCEACSNTGSIECEECDGDGAVEHECHCGDLHDKDCGKCDGEGFIGCKACPRGAQVQDQRRPVYIESALFNLNQFAELLPHVPGDEAVFRQSAPDRAALLEIGEWTLLVMPMRDDKTHTTAPRLSFADESVAA